MTAAFKFDEVKWDKLAPRDQLVWLSRYYGSDPEFTIAGGGNTSVKVSGRVYVKASGHALSTIGRDGFVAMSRKKLLAMLSARYAGNPSRQQAQVLRQMLAARLDPETDLRPSVEAVLHALLGHAFVVHTHSETVNIVNCSIDGRKLARKLFGDDVLWVDYTDPGRALALATAEAVQDYRSRMGRDPQIVLMQNHGLLVAADDPRQIKRLTDRVYRVLRRAGIGKPSKRPPFGRTTTLDGTAKRDLILAVGPTLRGLLSSDGRRRIVRFDESRVIVDLVAGADGRKAALAGSLYPDQIVYCGSVPMWVPARQGQQADTVAGRVPALLERYVRRHGQPPLVILVQGLGMFAVGSTAANADAVAALYRNSASIMAGARRTGGIQYLARRHVTFIEQWEAERYRMAVSRKGSAGRMADRIALVTGAAQGIGAGIAGDIVAQGGHVVVADMNVDGARRSCRDLTEKYGDGRAVACAVNVTDESSVAEMVYQAIRAFGGVDVLVSNAGVLRAGRVKELSRQDFDFVTSVNYGGYFLCVKHTAPVMARQHAANPTLRCDVVQVNSKSGLVGSNRNAAYAGSKFGGIGLTQSFALELIADGIKVNAVCPGNHLDGPLWSDPKTGLFVQYLKAGKVPGARTVADVRAAYEARVPMGRGLAIPDLMRAIYYLIEQQYETGQALPVTGGQVMLS